MIPQAIEALQSAVDADAGDPGFHYHLGLALAKLGNKEAAVEHFTRALTLKPDFSDAADATEQLRRLRAL